MQPVHSYRIIDARLIDNEFKNELKLIEYLNGIKRALGRRFMMHFRWYFKIV